MLFFENLHNLGLQGMQNISGHVTNSILTHHGFLNIYSWPIQAHFLENQKVILQNFWKKK